MSKPKAEGINDKLTHQNHQIYFDGFFYGINFEIIAYIKYICLKLAL